MSHTKGELIAMQMNLGLGHRGEIILTTQERIDNNLEPLAKDIFSEASAKDFVHRWNSQPDLLEACEAWMKVESEMGDKHPCPDLALRAQYRKQAVALTEAALAKAKKISE